MSIVNTKDRSILTKVVYYGTGLGGKTTSLQSVHSTLDPERRTRLISIHTDEERTLFFDFLPVELGALGGYRVRIQGYTVPGQVKYNQTRRHVLLGADAVVFVADSQAHRVQENEEAFQNLAENLEVNGLDINDVPLVLQYNKRDLDGIVSPEEMDASFGSNDAQRPRFLSTATADEGVFEPFVEAVRRMLDHVAARYGLESTKGPVGELAARRLRAIGASRP